MTEVTGTLRGARARKKIWMTCMKSWATTIGGAEVPCLHARSLGSAKEAVSVV
jgi:hypothetical protein